MWHLEMVTSWNAPDASDLESPRSYLEKQLSGPNRMSSQTLCWAYQVKISKLFKKLFYTPTGSTVVFWCWIGFCCTTAGITHKRTCKPPPEPPSHPPHPTHPDHTPCQWIYINATLPIATTRPFPSCVHTSVLYVCVSLPALQIGSSVQFFYIP